MLEESIAETLGLGLPVLTRSGTDAFTCALLSAGIVPGDEVILPVSICQTLVNAVFLLGGIPVLVDCMEDLSISPAEMQKHISDKTLAVLAHHPYGRACDFSGIAGFLSDKKIILIEDCAQAAGGCVHGQPVGHVGDISIFSFAHGKPFAAGVGGAVYVKDRAKLAYLREIATAGSPGCRDDHVLGIDSRLREAEARQIEHYLPHFKSALNERIEKVADVLDEFSGSGHIIGSEAAGCKPYCHVFYRIVLKLDGGGKNRADRLLGGIKNVLPDRQMAMIQTAVPAPPYALEFVNRRYEYVGRKDLCDMEGTRFSQWREIKNNYLFIRTSDEYGTDDLRAVARGLNMLNVRENIG